MKTKIFILGLLAAVLAMGFAAGDALANGAITGSVIDADGEPVAGAIVSIMGQAHQRGERPFRVRLETNENGTFGVRDVPAGRYGITAGAREVGMARVRAAVQDGEVTEVELQLQGRGGRGGGDDEERPEPGSVVGQVVNADGEPVAGAIVALVSLERRNHRGRHRGMRTRTAEDGTYSFENAPAGNYRAMAWARGVGRARTDLEVVAGEETEVDLTLQGR